MIDSAITRSNRCTDFALTGDARPPTSDARELAWATRTTRATATSPRRPRHTAPRSVAKTRLQQRGMLRKAAVAVAGKNGLRMSPEGAIHPVRWSDERVCACARADA